MPTGVSPLYYPSRQPQPAQRLRPDESYFLVKLHGVQAYFEAGWLVKPGYLTLSSTIESSFEPDRAMQSLHQVANLQKNIPYQAGFRTNLTDWLPARTTDSLRVKLNYTITQDSPFKELVSQMDRVGLVAKLSLVRPELAVAAKVSEISGRLLSYLLQEGQNRSLFELTMDLNVSDLKSGYYIIFGSPQETQWPNEVWVDEQGRLAGETYLFDKLCYAIIQVLVLPRRGEEVARGEPWWELLQAGKEQVVDAFPMDDTERRQLQNEWRSMLKQVRSLARAERGCLLAELREMIQSAQVEVEQKLSPRSLEADMELPAELQSLLEVQTEQELYDSAQNYQEALAASQRLRKLYAGEESESI